ncbi:hypothetical protein [Rhodococcus olei]|uniref:hypothetical protein n=1 Tax=Rhodococcus olei TaxID=2161675 RepID=UPI0031E59DD4
MMFDVRVTERIQMRFLGAATVLAALAVPAVLAPTAQALTPQTVFGTVTCKQGQRSSPPVAAWAVAEKGESGQAKIDDVPGEHGWVKSYTYTTYDAGRFRMVVACGGTAQQPSNAVATAWMKPGRHNLTLNF